MDALRESVNQRLAAAAEEIFGLFERKIKEYEEELSRYRQSDRQHKLMEVQVQLTDVQHLLLIKQEVPCELSLSLDQEDPESPIIKEEQEELWTSQKGEQLRGLEEADDTEVPLTPVCVKSEDEEEKPQLHQSQTEESIEDESPASSSAEHMETGADGEDCGGSGPAKNSDPHCHLQPDTDDKGPDSSETEDSEDDCKETRTPKSGLTSKTVDKSCSCSECGKRLSNKWHLQRHMKIHTGEKPFGCDVCGKRFRDQGYVKVHMNIHTRKKPFVCNVCGITFNYKCKLQRHMREHTGEKPFGCSVCGKTFNQHRSLPAHMQVHTGKQLFFCVFCGNRFIQQRNLSRHMKTCERRRVTEGSSVAGGDKV
ncbi:zinc finger and SCAN domain-containing protein 31-like [Seriola aureovittata]|uniref:zinc finger and SCAN domain-containing protein 31-like n=1 Tax=Seriola aureovittata TaxID=2871759 RepID=UPI0024BE7A66|nr:zinc finger and SCAN domain-containing protein 31-like [Seriola aureovittata]